MNQPVDGLRDETSSYASPDEGRREATPWQRYWARTFDISVGSAVTGFGLGLLFPAFFSEPVFSGAGGNYLAGLISLPFAFVLDALILALCGTTPGKAIAGIRVETLSGENLLLGQALRRNLQVYVKGLFFGIPLLVLYGYIRARERLERDDPTHWDEALGTHVADRRGNIVRTILVAILALAINFGAVALAGYAASHEAQWKAEEVVAALPDLNRGLPTFLDDVTRFDRVEYTAEENVLNLEHMLIHRDASIVRSDELPSPDQLRRTLVAGYCGPTLKGFRDRDIPVRYRYRYADGSIAYVYVFNTADCAPAAKAG